MQTRLLYLIRYVVPIVDLLLLNLVYLLSFSITGLEPNRQYIIVGNLLWLFGAALFDMYSEFTSKRLQNFYRGTVRTTILHFILFCIYVLFTKNIGFPRSFILYFYGILSVIFITTRFIGTVIQLTFIKRFYVKKKIAVLGNNRTGKRLAAYVRNQKHLHFYGFINYDEENKSDLTGELSDLVISEMKAAAAAGVVDMYVSVSPNRLGSIPRLVQEADKQLLRVKFVPDFAGSLATPYTISYLGGEFPVIALRKDPLENMSGRFKKRAFDLVFSSLVIVFVLSWLYPIIAILIKLQSPGPVLFKQQRSGRNDEPFWCLKFRSMTVNKDSDKVQATKGDSRITKIGAFLRKSSLDEMPQFFNVFMGDMSVVGPRPHMLSHTEEYRAIIEKFMVRHFVKPGITGWAQVNGFRGETKEDGSMEKRVEHDIWYMENWTVMLDVQIVFMTVINAVRGEENAY